MIKVLGTSGRPRVDIDGFVGRRRPERRALGQMRQRRKRQALSAARIWSFVPLDPNDAATV